jgi:hypothetical protein
MPRKSNLELMQRAAPRAHILDEAISKQLVTLHDRLAAGNLTVDEVCMLKRRSKSGFYSDLKSGLVTIRKIGRKSVVPGPVAVKYIIGEPLTEAR